MEREGEQAFGSWLWSQTVAIKSSGSGNVFLKLRAHILAVGHMQFLCMAPTLAVYPSWWRNMLVMKLRTSIPEQRPMKKLIQAVRIPADQHLLDDFIER